MQLPGRSPGQRKPPLHVADGGRIARNVAHPRHSPSRIADKSVRPARADRLNVFAYLVAWITVAPRDPSEIDVGEHETTATTRTRGGRPDRRRGPPVTRTDRTAPPLPFRAPPVQTGTTSRARRVRAALATRRDPLAHTVPFGQASRRSLNRSRYAL